jgi:hypothetical protein
LSDNNKKYIEIDGVANTANICDFNSSKEYLKYSDFKVSCKLVTVQINIDVIDEYVSEVEYSDYNSMIITLTSRTDITKNRKIWYGGESNLQPDFDFKRNYYLQNEQEMWEMPLQFTTEADLSARSYQDKSTSYFLNFEEKTEAFEVINITADDKDGPSLEFTIPSEQLDQFYPIELDPADSLDLDIDEYGYEFEFSNRKL